MNLQILGLSHTRQDRILLYKGLVIIVTIHNLYQCITQWDLEWTIVASSSWHRAEIPQKWMMIPHCRQWYRGWDVNKALRILIYMSVHQTFSWIVCLIDPHGGFDLGWVVVSNGRYQSRESAWQVVFQARRHSENAKIACYFGAIITYQKRSTFHNLDDLHYCWLQKLVRGLGSTQAKAQLSWEAIVDAHTSFQPLTKQSRKWTGNLELMVFLQWISQDFLGLTVLQCEAVPAHL